MFYVLRRKKRKHIKRAESDEGGEKMENNDEKLSTRKANTTTKTAHREWTNLAHSKMIVKAVCGRR